jgi:hypothetical protein
MTKSNETPRLKTMTTHWFLKVGISLVTGFTAFNAYKESAFMENITAGSRGMLKLAFGNTGTNGAAAATTTTTDTVTVTSMFDTAASHVYASILREQTEMLAKNKNSSISQNQHTLDLATWTTRTDGGLQDDDRKLLASFYGNATSVFEYGVGESTYIADHMGVARYAGVDSHPGYLDNVRSQASPHFRFYYGDVGSVASWGYPADDTLTKILWQYQVAPLYSEPEPFEVYFVDGRYRMACVLFSFLHASAKGAKHEDTTVLIHDCHRHAYHANDDILELVNFSLTANKRDPMLCVYKRKANTTDEVLLQRYENIKFDPF